MIGYKLFKVKNGQLYPLYVLADQPVEPGIWLKAREGPRKPNGKVSSKLGDLMAFVRYPTRSSHRDQREWCHQIHA